MSYIYIYIYDISSLRVNSLRFWDKIGPGNHRQNGIELHLADFVLRSYITNYVYLFVFHTSM